MKDSPAHLYRRFRYHVGPEPDPEDADRWAAERLEGAQQALFASMTIRDRVHSVAVARRTEDVLGEGHHVQAALLHDVGKALAPLGTTGRVVASLAEGTTLGDWLERRASRRPSGGRRGPLASMGAYLTYTELGARRLEVLGVPPMVSAWAREHHLPPERWTVPTDVGTVLAEFDEEL